MILSSLAMAPDDRFLVPTARPLPYRDGLLSLHNSLSVHESQVAAGS